MGSSVSKSSAHSLLTHLNIPVIDCRRDVDAARAREKEGFAEEMRFRGKLATLSLQAKLTELEQEMNVALIDRPPDSLSEANFSKICSAILKDSIARIAWDAWHDWTRAVVLLEAGDFSAAIHLVYAFGENLGRLKERNISGSGPRKKLNSKRVDQALDGAFMGYRKKFPEAGSRFDEDIASKHDTSGVIAKISNRHTQQNNISRWKKSSGINAKATASQLNQIAASIAEKIRRSKVLALES